MIDWLGDREYQIYAWSESDRAQIVHEIKAKKIMDEKILAFVEKENVLIWLVFELMEILLNCLHLISILTITI